MIRDKLIAALEEMAGIVVAETAATETEASQWLMKHGDAVDLVILDLMLAEGSGIGVLRSLRQRDTSFQVVVLTNYATQDIHERCMALGAVAMFDKSQQLDEFLAFCRAPAPSPARPLCRSSTRNYAHVAAAA